MNFKKSELKPLNLSHLEMIVLENLSTFKNPSELAEIIKEPRTSINYNLRKLFQRGLVRMVKRGKRKFYIINSPDNIRGLLQQALNGINIEFKGFRIKTNQSDEFIIHVGVDEIIPAFTRIAFENKNTRVKAIQHHKSFQDQMEVAKDQVIDFNQAIIKNKIIIDGILNEGAYKEYFRKFIKNPDFYSEQIQGLKGRMADYHVFPDDIFNFYAEIWFFENTTLIINWREKFGIEITNFDVTGFLKDMFEFVKSSCRKIDHNKEMENIFGNLNKK